MSDRILVSTRKGLFILARQAGEWRVLHAALSGAPMTAALSDPRAGVLYAAANHGHFGAKFYRSEDGGASFQELACPAFAKSEDGSGPSLFQIWCLEAGASPGTVWAGCIPDGLFRSDDRGESWRLIQPLWDRPERARAFGGGYDHPGIHSFLIDPRNPRHLIAAISCGGVWASEDEGESWEMRTDGLKAAYMPPEQDEDGAVQDPHRVSACAAAPDRLWMQHHNGVFMSRDAGRRWLRIEPPISGFGFAVAAHPADPETAWFAPSKSDEHRFPEEGRFCITRTRDGGRSFAVLETGLPRPAYDLVYRHGLDVDASGDQLALASTTGGLWTSRDGGERWQALSVRLPPVSAIRFA